ncbi:MAG TPA: amidohydrolase family protein, partial [Actinomycetota bacterium]|nr:amidohydrolase family protein [Actinomycetota bacterium]
MATLYTDARILGPRLELLEADAFVVDRDVFTWAGRLGDAPKVARCVSLDGRTVTPGFVDGHAHLTMTGLMLGGLDLHGVKSAQALVRRLAGHAEARADVFLYGTGWDDSEWATSPTMTMIDRVAGDRHVYLSRIDAHSALVSRTLLAAARCARMDGAEVGNDGRPTGIVRRDAHHAVRRYFFDRMPMSKIREAHRLAAEAAVAKGITTVHEMSGPLHAAGERDLDQLLKGTLSINVVCYYADEDITVATRRGLKQIGGDLNADGSLGSRTAARRDRDVLVGVVAD